MICGEDPNRDKTDVCKRRFFKTCVSWFLQAARKGLRPPCCFQKKRGRHADRQSASSFDGLRLQSRVQKRNVSGQSTPPTSTIRKYRMASGGIVAAKERVQRRFEPGAHRHDERKAERALEQLDDERRARIKTDEPPIERVRKQKPQRHAEQRIGVFDAMIGEFPYGVCRKRRKLRVQHERACAQQQRGKQAGSARGALFPRAETAARAAARAPCRSRAKRPHPAACARQDTSGRTPPAAQRQRRRREATGGRVKRAIPPNVPVMFCVCPLGNE